MSVSFPNPLTEKEEKYYIETSDLSPMWRGNILPSSIPWMILSP